MRPQEAVYDYRGDGGCSVPISSGIIRRKFPMAGNFLGMSLFSCQRCRILRAGKTHIAHLTAVRPTSEQTHKAILESSPHRPPN